MQKNWIKIADLANYLNAYQTSLLTKILNLVQDAIKRLAERFTATQFVIQLREKLNGKKVIVASSGKNKWHTYYDCKESGLRYNFHYEENNRQPIFGILPTTKTFTPAGLLRVI